MAAAANGSPDNEPINLDAAIDMFGGDRDLVKSIVEAFLIETPQLMTALETSLVNSDAPAAMRAAHTMKSNFNNLCLTEIANQCQQVEQRAKDNDLADIDENVKRLRNDVQIAIGKLQSFVRS